MDRTVRVVIVAIELVEISAAQTRKPSRNN